MAVIKKDKKCGLINTNGEILFLGDFNVIKEIGNGMAVVVNGFYHGFINLKGDVVIPCKYPIAGGFCKAGVAMVVDENFNGGLVDKNGNETFLQR